MSAKERAEDLQEFVQRELDDLIQTLESQDISTISQETKEELSAVYGSELVNRLFGKRDFTILPELSSLATSSVKTRALFLAELKIWEKIMRNVLVSKNNSVAETGRVFNDKTGDLYNQLNDLTKKQVERHIQEINEAHKKLVQVLENEAKEIKEIHDKGDRVRSTDKDSIKRAVEEHRTQINLTIKKAVEAKVDEVMRDIPYNEYRQREYEVNKLHCLAYFLLGGSLVSAGFILMKIFN